MSESQEQKWIRWWTRRKRIFLFLVVKRPNIRSCRLLDQIGIPVGSFTEIVRTEPGVPLSVCHSLWKCGGKRLSRSSAHASGKTLLSACQHARSACVSAADCTLHTSIPNQTPRPCYIQYWDTMFPLLVNFSYSNLHKLQFIAALTCIHSFSSIDKVKVLSLMLHAADISHPAKAWPLHYHWTHSLMEEFFRQVPHMNTNRVHRRQIPFAQFWWLLSFREIKKWNLVFPFRHSVTAKLPWLPSHR